MYQHKVAVDMLDAVKSVGWRFKRWSFVRGRATLFTTPAYPHQPCVDTLYLLPLCRGRPKLVLTGTNYSSIPLYTYVPLLYDSEKRPLIVKYLCAILSLSHFIVHHNWCEMLSKSPIFQRDICFSELTATTVGKVWHEGAALSMTLI